MDKGLKKELKKILSGRVIVNEDGVLTALSDNQRLIFHGLPEGWESVRFRGITKRESRLRIVQENGTPFDLVFSAMQNLGRLVELKQAPETLACIRRYVFRKPVVIAVDYEGDGVVRVTVYTGRSLLAGSSCRRGLNDFCRALPPCEVVFLDADTKKTIRGEKKKKERPERARQKKGKREV